MMWIGVINCLAGIAPFCVDKTEHIVAYGLLTGAIHLSLWPRRWSLLKTAIVVLVIIMVYGALDEITQPIFGRSCDILDWLADVSGCAIALTVMSLAKLAMPRSQLVEDSVASSVQDES